MISSLNPPTKYSLSDIVIWEVTDRVAPQHSRMEPSFLADSSSLSGHSAFEMRAITQHQFPRSFEDLSSEDAKALKLSQQRSNVATRREKSRLHQARYRIRQREHLKNMTASIGRLKVDILDLETRRHTITSRTAFCKSVWSVAIEYFRLFQHGFMTPLLVPNSDRQTSVTVEERPHQLHAQIDFLRETVAHDVTDGVDHGVEALLENWKRLSLYYDDVNVELKRLEYVAVDSLQATTTVGLTITESTLQNLFPHLLDSRANDNEEKQKSSLAAKLLNQRIIAHGSARFDWDPSSCRVIRLGSKLDMLSPVLELLGSLEDVTRVFDAALVTPEGRFTTNNFLS